MSESSIIRVLLVEDNPSDTLWVKKALGGKIGTKVELIHAECLSASLEKLKGETVDAILLNLTLPDSQGLDTFYRIKALAPDIPILIFSGVVDEALAVEAVQHGAQDYLVKGSVFEVFDVCGNLRLDSSL